MAKSGHGNMRTWQKVGMATRGHVDMALEVVAAAVMKVQIIIKTAKCYTKVTKKRGRGSR